MPGRCDDAVRDAAQRHDRAVRERRRLRQAMQPRRDPAAVLLRECLRLLQAAARRHGEHDLARRGLDAQRVAARLPVPAQPDEIDRLVEDDLDRLRFGRTAIEQRAQRHDGTPHPKCPTKYCHIRQHGAAPCANKARRHRMRRAIARAATNDGLRRMNSDLRGRHGSPPGIDNRSLRQHCYEMQTCGVIAAQRARCSTRPICAPTS